MVYIFKRGCVLHPNILYSQAIGKQARLDTS